jgi:hypothetical protein
VLFTALASDVWNWTQFGQLTRLRELAARAFGFHKADRIVRVLKGGASRLAEMNVFVVLVPTWICGAFLCLAIPNVNDDGSRGNEVMIVIR